MSILVNRDGQQFGPYTADEARAALQSGQLLPGDLAWTDGMDAWLPLSQVLQGSGSVLASPVAYQAASGKTSGFAITSLILGIASYFCGLSIFAALPAIIFGHVARANIKSSRGGVKGGGLALTGLILGYLYMVLAAALLFVVLGPMKNNVMGFWVMGKSTAIASGCTRYAGEHEGHYPDKLEDLVPKYLPNASLLSYPTLQPPGSVGYDFPAAGKQNLKPEDLLLISKWQDASGQRIYTTVNGVPMLRGDAPPAP